MADAGTQRGKGLELQTDSSTEGELLLLRHREAAGVESPPDTPRTPVSRPPTPPGRGLPGMDDSRRGGRGRQAGFPGAVP